LLASPIVLIQGEKYATGIAQKTLGLSSLRKIIVPLPPLNEQKRIVAKVDELFALCDQLAGQVTAAESSREQLLTAVLAQAV